MLPKSSGPPLPPPNCAVQGSLSVAAARLQQPMARLMLAG